MGAASSFARAGRRGPEVTASTGMSDAECLPLKRDEVMEVNSLV